jgi:streptogramin lyase
MLSFRRDHRDATLIERYWSALRRNRATPVPDGLDPDLAAFIAEVNAELTPPKLSTTTIEQLWRRVEARAPEGNRDGWSGPAIDPSTRRRTAAPAITEREEQPIMSDHVQSADIEPIPLQQRRWLRETLKFVAAAIVFITIGAVLALTLRDDQNEPAIGPPANPSPTSTPTVLATASATENAGDSTTTVSPLDSLPISGSVLSTLDVDSSWWRSIAVGAGSIWITNGTSGRVERIDPSTGEVVAQIQVGLPDDSQQSDRPNVWGIAYGRDAVWVTASLEKTIIRIDPSTNEITDTIYVDSNVGSIVVTDDAIWAGSYDEPYVLRLDPESHATLATIRVAERVRKMQVVDGFLWVRGYSGRLSQVDTATNAVQPPLLGDMACICSASLAGDASGLWTLVRGRGIIHLDPTTGSEIALLSPSSGFPVELAISGDLIWVVVGGTGDTGHLELIEPTTDSIVGRGPSFNLVPEDGHGLYLDVAVDGDTLWIVNSLNTVVEIDLAQ